ncbi:hypothetical protein FGO68_gene3179 [Halteria grandinella]|uniref:Uncharacterized protein n=1 Tax=Halteria grandinella TaxID=5974 RepID=A0A8J8NRT9_HALGN|nr:hypothetical protein FGO68_gene3179 [Halteria grandinella]
MITLYYYPMLNMSQTPLQLPQALFPEVPAQPKSSLFHGTSLFPLATQKKTNPYLFQNIKAPQTQIVKRPCQFVKQVCSFDLSSVPKCEFEGFSLLFQEIEESQSPTIKCRVPINLLILISFYLRTNTQYRKFTVLSKRSRSAVMERWQKGNRPDPLRVVFSDNEEIRLSGISNLFRFSQDITLVLYSPTQKQKINQQLYEYIANPRDKGFKLAPQGELTLFNMENFFAQSITIIDYDIRYVKHDFNLNIEIGDDYLSMLFLVVQKEKQVLLLDYINRDYLRLANLFELIERSSKVKKLIFRNIQFSMADNIFDYIQREAAIPIPQRRGITSKTTLFIEKMQSGLSKMQRVLESITFSDCEVSAQGMLCIDQIYQTLGELVFQGCRFSAIIINRALQIPQKLPCLHSLKIIVKGNISDFNDQDAKMNMLKNDSDFSMGEWQIISIKYLMHLVPLHLNRPFSSLQSVDLSLVMPDDPIDLTGFLSQQSIIRDYSTEFTLEYIRKLMIVLNQMGKITFTTLHIARLLLKKQKGVSPVDFRSMIESGLSSTISSVKLRSLDVSAEQLIIMEYGVTDFKSTLKVIIHTDAGTYYIKYV